MLFAVDVNDYRVVAVGLQLSIKYWSSIVNLQSTTGGGKGSGRSPVGSDGQSHQSIDHESTWYTHT